MTDILLITWEEAILWAQLLSITRTNLYNAYLESFEVDWIKCLFWFGVKYLFGVLIFNAWETRVRLPLLTPLELFTILFFCALVLNLGLNFKFESLKCKPNFILTLKFCKCIFKGWIFILSHTLTLKNFYILNNNSDLYLYNLLLYILAILSPLYF